MIHPPATRVGSIAPAALAALVAAGGLAGACASTAPEARVADLHFVERTDAGALYALKIEGANHTKKDLRLESVRYWMNVGGKRVFEASRSPQATFSALSERSFTVPIAVPVGALPVGAGEVPYKVGAAIMYHVPGPLAKTFFDLGLRRPRVLVRSAGVAPADPEPTP